MIHLQTLGAFRVRGSEGELRVGRKELALLVYLARHSPRAVPRSELAALFWGERDETQARHSLRQALVRLRRAVPLPVAVDAEQVALPPGDWELDVAALESDLAAGRRREAVERWHGEFLPRAEETGGEEYRHWVEVEREALRRRVGSALEDLLAEAERAGDRSAAVEWAARWADLKPLDEHPQRRLVEALRLAGRADEAGARHAAYVARCRADLGADPSPEFHRLGAELARAVGTPDRPAGRPGSRALFTPDLVGRGSAFDELSACWAAARAGTAVVVLVEGDEGVGKTRLCDEFLRSLLRDTDAPLVLRARGHVGRWDTPWAFARELLAPLKAAPGLPGASPHALAALTRELPTLRDRFPAAATAADAGYSFEEAVADGLTAVAADAPVVILADDLPSADVASQQLILSLARRLLHGRVLLLVTGRAADLDRSPALEDLRSGYGVHRLRLPPLAQPDVEVLLASMLDLSPAERRALAERLHRETAGLPLYIIETVAALVDEGHIAPDAAGVWRAGAALSGQPLPLPSGVREAISRRLDFLSPGARTVAEAAAVLAAPASEEVLQRIAVSPPADFDGALGELLARHLLRGSPGAYAFTHEASRRATYELIPAGRRRELHAAAARALARIGDSTAPSTVRYHRTRAGSAAWPLPRWVRGRRALPLLAGIGAVAILGVILAWPTGIGFREREWVLLADLDNQTGDSLFDQSLTAALAMALSQSRYVNVYPPPRVRETLRRMRSDSVQRLDDRLAREVAQREDLRAVVTLSIARRDTAYTMTARVVDPESGADLAELSAAAAAPDRLLGALDDLARRLRRTLGESLGAVQRHSIYLPRASTASLEALKRFAEGDVAWATGREREAQALWEEAIALDSGFAWAHAALGTLHYRWNRRAEADRHFRLALNLADRLPDRERLWIRHLAAQGEEAVRLVRAYLREYPDDRDGWFSLGRRLQSAGERAEAIEAYRRVVVIDRNSAVAFINIAVCQDLLGRPREAVEAFERAFAIWPEGVTQVAGDINRIYGFSYLRLGDSARARAAFERLLTGPPGGQASGHRSLALLHQYYGRYGLAIGHLRRAVLLTATGGVSEYRNRLYLAAALRARGDTAAALAQLAAAKLTQRVIPPSFLGFLGQQYARAGRRDEAARILDSLTARMNPDDPDDRQAGALVRGEIALAAGDATAGVEAFEVAMLTGPNSVVRDGLARAQMAAGQTAQAIATYHALLADSAVGWEVQEPWIMAPYQLARLYQSRNDTANAITYYRRFLNRWAAGDPDLAALADARRSVRALEQASGRR